MPCWYIESLLGGGGVAWQLGIKAKLLAPQRNHSVTAPIHLNPLKNPSLALQDGVSGVLSQLMKTKTGTPAPNNKTSMNSNLSTANRVNDFEKHGDYDVDAFDMSRDTLLPSDRRPGGGENTFASRT